MQSAGRFGASVSKKAFRKFRVTLPGDVKFRDMNTSSLCVPQGMWGLEEGLLLDPSPGKQPLVKPDQLRRLCRSHRDADNEDVLTYENSANTGSEHGRGR